MDSIINIFLAMPVLALLVLALYVAVIILIIRLICQYAAKQNAKEFDYDYLAQRTAEAVCKRMKIMEQEKSGQENANGDESNAEE